MVKLNKVITILILVVCAFVPNRCTQIQPTLKPSLLAFPATKSIPRHTEQGERMVKEYQERLELRKQFTAPARQLALRANDERVAVIYNFLIQHSVLAVPIARATVRATNSTAEPSFELVVLKEKDASLGSPWSSYLSNQSACAWYVTDMKTMVIKSAPKMIDEIKGVVILHEAFHAWDHLVNGAAPTDPEHFCLGEIRAHEFIGFVLRKAKPGYESLVEKSSKLVERMGVDKQTTFDTVKEYIKQGLIQLYGTSTNKQAEGMWSQTFYSANFLAIERNLPKEQWVATKVAFLKDWLERIDEAQW